MELPYLCGHFEGQNFVDHLDDHQVEDKTVQGFGCSHNIGEDEVHSLVQRTKTREKIRSTIQMNGNTYILARYLVCPRVLRNGNILSGRRSRGHMRRHGFLAMMRDITRLSISHVGGVRRVHVLFALVIMSGASIVAIVVVVVIVVAIVGKV